MLNLTATQIDILKFLRQKDQGIELLELISVLKTNKRSTQKLIGQLIEHKLISRDRIGRSFTYKIL